jgi:polysaccharide biosynthesis/export protein
MRLRFLTLLLLLLSLSCGRVAFAQISNEYLLGPGDVVNIRVFQNPDLNIDARVSELGTIDYPLIGRTRVVGLTAPALADLIAKRLVDGNFVRQPNVTASVGVFRSIQVSVLGLVTRPGKYPMEQSVNRVSEVLALAGGPLPAAGDLVWLITSEEGKERKVEIDVAAIMQSGDRSRDPVVKNGDTIFVPRGPQFYVYGEVQRAGQYRLERGTTVTQALAIGGGPTPRGTDRGMRISRRDAAGTLITRDALPNEPLAPDDVLLVRERLF